MFQPCYLEDGLPGIVSGWDSTPMYKPWKRQLRSGPITPGIGDKNDDHCYQSTIPMDSYIPRDDPAVTKLDPQTLEVSLNNH